MFIFVGYNIPSQVNRISEKIHHNDSEKTPANLSVNPRGINRMRCTAAEKHKALFHRERPATLYGWIRSSGHRMELELPHYHQRTHSQYDDGEFPVVRKIPRLCFQFHRFATLQHDERILSRTL